MLRLQADATAAGGSSQILLSPPLSVSPSSASELASSESARATALRQPIPSIQIAGKQLSPIPSIQIAGKQLSPRTYLAFSTSSPKALTRLSLGGKQSACRVEIGIKIYSMLLGKRLSAAAAGRHVTPPPTAAGCQCHLARRASERHLNRLNPSHSLRSRSAIDRLNTVKKGYCWLTTITSNTVPSANVGSAFGGSNSSL